ncbi:MAG: antitoxin component YwqK of YwqJK toxin-antitoxin module [Crocinitomix sp.]|jgi:antitoxin component YwqK of YwqJK toxin-antitoxin module
MVRLAQLPNNILLALFLLCTFACETEKERFDVALDHGKLTKVKGVYFLFDETLNGRIFSSFENGDTAAIAEYTEGVKNGVTRKWYEGGQLKFEGHYKDGNYEGSVTEWYPSGQAYSLFNYENGKEVGRQQAWLENGKFKANYEVIGDRKYGLTGIKNCSNDWEE